MAFGPKNEHEQFVASYGARKKALSGNKTVTRPIPKIDSDIVKRKLKGGRQKKYTPTRMKNAINKYFVFCEENDEVPSIKGMMIHLKMYYETFYTYLRYPEFTDIMEHARMIIANWAEQDVYQTKGMAAGKIAYMKNIHGWSEQIEQRSMVEQRVITVDEAKAKIAAVAPKLLELLQNAGLTDQIAGPKVIEAEVSEGGG